MKLTAELDLKLSEESKREVFFSLIYEKFGFHKKFFIQNASVYEMRENGIGESPFFIKKASPLDICIFEIFKKLK
jgi:hypothetical protein